MSNLQVNIKSKTNKIYFSDINPCDLFVFGEEVWLKYAQVKYDQGRDQHQYSQAISINNGMVGSFEEDEVVTRISSAVLTVEVVG